MIVDGIKFSWKHVKEDSGDHPNVTLCTIETSSDSEHIVGEARCSESDQYSRDIGRKLSLLRAMQSAGMSKSVRTKVWNAYRTLTRTPRW